MTGESGDISLFLGNQQTKGTAYEIMAYPFLRERFGELVHGHVIDFETPDHRFFIEVKAVAANGQPLRFKQLKYILSNQGEFYLASPMTYSSIPAVSTEVVPIATGSLYLTLIDKEKLRKRLMGGCMSLDSFLGEGGTYRRFARLKKVQKAVPKRPKANRNRSLDRSVFSKKVLCPKCMRWGWDSGTVKRTGKNLSNEYYYRLFRHPPDKRPGPEKRCYVRITPAPSTTSPVVCVDSSNAVHRSLNWLLIPPPASEQRLTPQDSDSTKGRLAHCPRCGQPAWNPDEVKRICKNPAKVYKYYRYRHPLDVNTGRNKTCYVPARKRENRREDPAA